MEEEVTAHLARNLIDLRQRRRLSQAALAEKAGIPRSTITYMESGTGNPSLKNLCRISAALQVGIESLLARPRPECTLIHADQVPVERRGAGANLFKLLPDPIPGMEIDRLEIAPGGKLGGLPHLEHTKEYLTCLEGEVEVHVAGESYRVAAGDVLAFPGNRPHAYQNSGHTRAVCVSVVVLAR